MNRPKQEYTKHGIPMWTSEGTMTPEFFALTYIGQAWVYFQMFGEMPHHKKSWSSNICWEGCTTCYFQKAMTKEWVNMIEQWTKSRWNHINWQQVLETNII